MLYMAGAVFFAPGVTISLKGVRSYVHCLPEDLWWLMSISAAVLAGFAIMFTRIVDRYAARIEGLPDGKTDLWHIFSTKGWILIAFMLCLGMAMKRIPGIPAEFFASFYCGLGPALLYAGCRFPLRSGFRS